LPLDPTGLPALPDAYEAAVYSGLAALGLVLDADARAAIDAHVRLLLAWNDAINLTAITAPEAVALRHVVDSLSVVPLLRRDLAILDLGSGGGFPGLPVAAAVPASRVTLVDAVAKKAAFLEAAVQASGLRGRVSVRAVRAESLAGVARWEVVLARGVGPLSELVELAMPLLAPGGRLIAWKRGAIDDELAAATRAAAALRAGPPRIHESVPGGGLDDLAGHVLVEVRKTGPTPPGYPRDPSLRRRRAW
jgi:16S rRNA (guanine527-N7)-methyltransferase